MQIASHWKQHCFVPLLWGQSLLAGSMSKAIVVKEKRKWKCSSQESDIIQVQFLYIPEAQLAEILLSSLSK